MTPRKTTGVLDCLADGDGVLSRGAILDRTGLAPATLTRLLRQLRQAGYVDRVERGCYRLGPRARRLGRTGADGRTATGTVHVLAESLVHFEALLQSARQELTGYGLKVAAHPLGKPLSQLREDDLEFLEDSRGLLVLSLLPLPEVLIRWADGHDLPLVKAGLAEHCGCDTFSWDQEHAYHTMTCRLLERGHRSVLFYGPSALADSVPFFLDRREGYERAMRRAGREPRAFMAWPGFLFPRSDGAPFRRMLRDAERPTALVVLGNAGHVTRLLTRLSAWGYQPGPDFSVSGVVEAGDAEENELLRSEFLLGVCEPWGRVGQAAGRRLVQRIEGDAAPPAASYVAGRVLEMKGAPDGEPEE